MADSATLTRVDLNHRAQQAQLASRIARLIQGYWLLVDGDRLAETGAPWLRQSIDAIQRGRRESSLLAAAYAEQVHQLQLPRAPRLTAPRVGDAPEEKLRISLEHVALRYAAVNLAKTPKPGERIVVADDEEADRAEREQAARERRENFIMEQALANAMKAAVKHVVDGARDMTDQMVTTKQALGYFRVTQSESPCGFCLMLASRGPVYEDDSFDESDPRFTGPGRHKVHDGCMCTLRPVFTRSEAEWSDQARRADGVWRDHGKAVDGRSPVENFRYHARILGIADQNRYPGAGNRFAA